MTLQVTPYVLILATTAAVSASVALVAWKRRRKLSAGRPFAWMMFAVTGYAAVGAMEAAVLSLPEKIFWSSLEYLGSGSVSTLFVLFVLRFTRPALCLSPRHLAALWLLPALNLALVASNHWHHLVWTGFAAVADRPHLVAYQHGPGYVWILGCIYLYVLTAAWLLWRSASKSSALHRRQAGTLLLGAAAPLLGSLVYSLDLTPVGLNLTPMSFALTGLISLIALFRFQIFNLIPVARHTLVEHMEDGVLVLDRQNRLVDINPAARRMIGKDASRHALGRPITDILGDWPQVRAWLAPGSEPPEAPLHDPRNQHYFDVRITPLQDGRKRPTGHILVLRDVSQNYIIHTQLRQTNRILQRKLTEIEELQTRLREQAIRDGLTGLFNRRYFEETLQWEMGRAEREGYGISIILMDIDFFKRVNDTFGHKMGDDVLRAFATLLRDHSRSNDIPCRYGGEEFVLALPGMSADTAFARAEQIRQAFPEMAKAAGVKNFTVTVSGGVGAFPDHAHSLDSLIQTVDKALYAAKNAGRNNIRYAAMAPAEPTEPVILPHIADM
jgi:diguanylate cyclase (GGDEF)-like protein